MHNKLLTTILITLCIIILPLTTLAQSALTPIATQTFSKGQYTVDHEFSKSDGVTSGTVAKFKAQKGAIANPGRFCRNVYPEVITSPIMI